MNSDNAMALLRAVYDEVHLALWAALTAFVIYFAAFVAPRLPAFQAAAERHRIEQIAAADEAYCAKWHMGAGTAIHDECLSDLQHLRAKIADRFAEEADF